MVFLDSSKRRSSMRMKCSKEKSELMSSVVELNTVRTLLGLPTANSEDILAGNFPWSFEGPTTSKGTCIPSLSVDLFLLQ